jgi:hypothetical protein
MATYNDAGVHLRSFHQDDNFDAEDLDGRIMPLLPAGSMPGKHADQSQRLVTALDTGDWNVLIPALAAYFRFFDEQYPDEVGSAFQFGIHVGDDVQISRLVPLKA